MREGDSRPETEQKLSVHRRTGVRFSVAIPHTLDEANQVIELATYSGIRLGENWLGSDDENAGLRFPADLRVGAAGTSIARQLSWLVQKVLKVTAVGGRSLGSTAKSPRRINASWWSVIDISARLTMTSSSVPLTSNTLPCLAKGLDGGRSGGAIVHSEVKRLLIMRRIGKSKGEVEGEENER